MGIVVSIIILIVHSNTVCSYSFFMILFLEKNKGLYEHAIILSAGLLLIFIDRDANKFL